MKRTVEIGKTLLIDGPASVTVTSGKVEVFGSTVNNVNKIVIREDKRLPFMVEETAAFEISLGENATAEEVEGNTIPTSWNKAFEELTTLQNRPITAMILGAVDSGKTSFCTYIINKLLNKKQKSAILDGDLGQSDIGPPCTVAYTFVKKPTTDLFNLEARNAFFIGVTSPNMAISKIIEGLASLKREILVDNPDFVVVNTDGWIDGEDAINFKVQLAEKLSPDIIFYIQQNDELPPMLNALGKHRLIVVNSPPAIKQRSKEKRRNLRELGYIKYLKNAKVLALPLNWLKIEGNDSLGLGKTHEDFRKTEKIYALLGMKPLHFTEQGNKIVVIIGKNRWINKENIEKIEKFTKKEIEIIRKGEEERLLMALYDVNRKFLGIGILREVDYLRKTLKILTPATGEISIVSLGNVKLDKCMKEVPNFEEEEKPELSTLRKLF